MLDVSFIFRDYNIAREVSNYQLVACVISKFKVTRLKLRSCIFETNFYIVYNNALAVSVPLFKLYSDSGPVWFSPNLRRFRKNFKECNTYLIIFKVLFELFKKNEEYIFEES